MKYNVKWRIFDNTPKGVQTVAFSRKQMDIDDPPDVAKANWLRLAKKRFPEQAQYGPREYTIEMSEA